MLDEKIEPKPTLPGEIQEATVRAQLDRLLSSSFFSHSKRLPAFLRFVTERALSGYTDATKERTLGIELFGRDPDYDTSTDPVVRVTAAEVRKRLAQYYQDASHTTELRILLPSGTYIPQFDWPKNDSDLALKALEQDAEQDLALSSKSNRSNYRGALNWLQLVALSLGVAAVTVMGVLVWQNPHRTAVGYFWKPLLDSPGTVLLCVANQNDNNGNLMPLLDAADPFRKPISTAVPLQPGTQKIDLTTVALDDLNAIVKAAGLLQSNSKPYRLRGEDQTTMADLRTGPAIFFGAFDNAWTLRLTNPLRYHFWNNPEMTRFQIVDSMSSGKTGWVLDRTIPTAINNYRDYAIIARFTDPNTGQLAVIVAGMARGGTIAAGEFLVDAAQIAQIQRAAQAAGNKQNMELVISTQVIDGEPGTSKLEASYFW